jgi:hypothetical protein|tara:strand:+ start:235 stop:444 length:210 start_codon:yes stop_codon:yes gene_type:complete
MKDKIREICYDLEIGCIDWTEASEQLLVLCDVSQQRELLKAYAELIQSSYTNHFFDDAVEESIDEFLSL